MTCNENPHDTMRTLDPSELTRVNGGSWADLRMAESGGDYGKISPSGKYRGAYQFSRKSWAWVGGHGDPARASHHEQDLRARILYRRIGMGAWPENSWLITGHGPRIAHHGHRPVPGWSS